MADLVFILSVFFSSWFLLGSRISSNTVCPSWSLRLPHSRPFCHAWRPRNHAKGVMGPGELWKAVIVAGEGFSCSSPSQKAPLTSQQVIREKLSTSNR